VLNFIDPIENDTGDFAGICLHQVDEDLDPLRLPFDVKADPIFVLVDIAPFEGLLLLGHLQGHRLRVEPGLTFQLIEERLRRASEPQLPGRHPSTCDHMPVQVRGRHHQREIQRRYPEPVPVGHRPYGFALHILGSREADEVTVLFLEKEIENAVGSRPPAGHQ